MKKILIVGGVAGGASAAARLRRLNEKAEIILFERGEHISFANCGLPYYIGGEIVAKEKLTLQTPESFQAQFNIDVRVFNEVMSINKKAKTITVKNHITNEIYTESYDKLILSPGAEPIKPNIEGINSNKVFTLRNIPDTFKIKEYIETNHSKSAAIVGGGFIGVEMAENLHAIGLEVTLIEMQEQILPPLDYDMACDVHQYMERKGINLTLKNGVKAIIDNGDTLTIKLNEGEVRADILIMAIGVRPESGLARDAGLDVSEHGHIIVSDNMLTSDPNILAVGDAVGPIPLAGPANKQGRIAADVICELDSQYIGTQGSAILKIFDMTVASTGVNEKTALRLGLDYDKSFIYSADHATYYPGATYMSIKTIFEKKTGKILGAQIVGFDGVDKRCDVFATAIYAGMTAYDLTKLELCYAPPYSSAKDPVNMAGFVIENLLTDKVKHFHWHDVNNLPSDGSVTLLDIRTQVEYESGAINGFINIPLNELRNRLNELDKSKPVYVTCQIGIRGYVAARILTQNGFDVYNLSGGYRLYRNVYLYISH
ncbi:MAG: FAD-dependent oxidoreductase [Firmicutes bacterium]|nr:FAD-dependent oxidoreductase [Bacillota bacterium]